MTHKRARRARRPAGFSLVEVLIALGVFSLVAGLLSGALVGGQTYVARLDTSRHVTEDRLALRRIAGGWLQSATSIASGRVGDGNGETSGFAGGERYLEFFTTYDGGLGPGLYRMTLAVESAAGGGSRLRAGRRRVEPDAPEGDDAPAVVLTDLFASAGLLTFVYGQPSAVSGFSWQAEWLGTGQLPSHVQLREDGNPIVTVAIAGTTAARCLRRHGFDGLAAGKCGFR